MDVHSWVTLATIAAIAVALVRDVVRPDLVFLGGLGVLLVVGVITPGEAFTGFANPAVIAVGALFVIAAGIEESGVLRAFERLLFGAGTSLPRFLIPVAGLSAFINNTPIVAMLTQPLQRWAARRGIAPSKVLIPLSYAAIAGGMGTLIGTSTNVIVSGLLVQDGYDSLGLFELTWTGVPAAVVVVVFMSTIGRRLLPDRGLRQSAVRQSLPVWTFEVRVRRRALRTGRTATSSDLMRPGDAKLVHVRRGDFVLEADADMVLEPNDVLAYSGDVTVLEELLERPGLEPGMSVQVGKTLPLYEAVVSDTSFLVGRTLSEAQFRERYGAVVLAVQRKTERAREPLGRLPIKAGDLLLVGAAEGYTDRWNASSEEFYYVASRRSPRTRFDRRKAYSALAVLVVMVVAIGTRVLALATAAFGAALAMIALDCLSMDRARRALDLQVLMLIAAALGLGQAVAKTGLTDGVADVLLGLSGVGIAAVLVALYVTTNLLTELITHKAAAVLMLPVALAMAVHLGVEPKAFALTVAVAAAASFMTPVGYQTNLMVMAAGQYRVRDYFRVGLPVSLLVMVTSIIVILLKWV